MDKTAIQELRDGKLILMHTGNVENLNRVLKAAFPNDLRAIGTLMYYSVSPSNRDYWRGTNLRSYNAPVTYPEAILFKPQIT